MPDSFATTDNGLLLIANGWNPVLRWDGLTSEAVPAGVLPPTTAVTITGSGIGPIVGTYFAFVRFVDGNGNFSNLSPISAESVLPLPDPTSSGDGTLVDLELNSFANIVKAIGVVPYLQSLVGTPNGFIKFTGAAFRNGIFAYSDTHPGSPFGPKPPALEWAIYFKTQGYTIYKAVHGTNVAHFTVGAAGTTGSSDAGVAAVTYSNVPVPTEAKVVRRQILRNTTGQTQTFYVDVDTTDLTSPTLTGTLSDVLLAAQPFFSLFDSNNNSQLDLYHVPPCHKSVMAAHLSRMYYGVDIEYSEGCVAVTYGLKSVQGIGTEWSLHLGGQPQFVSRFLYVVGGNTSYQIASVDPINQVLTLASPYLGQTDAFASYAIRPAPGERRLVYFSEASLPEAVPSTNAFGLPEDSDNIVGLMPKGSFLYVLEKKHIYRFTAGGDPANDGFVFLNTTRGCLNNRCWVIVEDDVYLLDEGGIWNFTGGGSQPLSEPIQDMFETYPGPDDTERINWAAQGTFHAVHYQAQAVIRWFVNLAGQYLPRHCIAFAYRAKRWWIESFPFGIGSSCLGRLNDDPQIYLGGPAGKVYAYGQGYLDGPDPSAGTVQGTVTGTTPTSFSDSSATLPSSGLVGNPVAIIGGRGKGQLRRVTSVSGQRVNLDLPWAVLPDTTSVYQLGGIPYQYRSGWFRWAQAEEEHPRRLEIVFEPVAHAASLDARLFLDRASTPVLWDTTYASADQNQFSSTQGTPDLTADLTKASGFVQRRMDGRREFYVDGLRYVQIELVGIGNQDGVTVYRLTLDGAVQ